jgi:hypothetical protein
MRATLLFFAASVALGLASATAAQQAVYPAQGQSPEQQQQDEAACSDWARSQSGFDPANPTAPPTAQEAPVTGSGARVRGAAAGATFGAIGGNAGAGAAAGAVAGGMGRRVRNSNAAQAQNQAAAQSSANLQASYDRARSACLSGRGYSVR